MNNLTTFDINKFTPYAVGFDRVFDRLWDHAHNMHTSTGFPPYNIVKNDEYEFTIEMALAGFSKEDIEVVVVGGHGWLVGTTCESTLGSTDHGSVGSLGLHASVEEAS